MTHSMTIPWPNALLSPNARSHWRPVAKVKKATRAAVAHHAYWCGLIAPASDKIEVRLTFHPKDKRRRDVDNLLASMKAALDGIADHLGVDDYVFIPRVEVGALDPEKKGFVRVELVPAQ